MLSPDEHTEKGRRHLSQAETAALGADPAGPFAQLATAHFLAALLDQQQQPLVVHECTTDSMMKFTPSEGLYDIRAWHADAAPKADQLDDFDAWLHAALRQMVEEPCCPTGEETARRALDGTFPPTAAADVLRGDEQAVAEQLVDYGTRLKNTSDAHNEARNELADTRAALAEIWDVFPDYRADEVSYAAAELAEQVLRKLKQADPVPSTGEDPSESDSARARHGMTVVHKSGSRHVLDRPKLDGDGGWWLAEGSGLSDWALDSDDWQLVPSDEGGDDGYELAVHDDQFPEIAVMDQVLTAFKTLDPDAQRRALRWLTERLTSDIEREGGDE